MKKSTLNNFQVKRDGIDNRSEVDFIKKNSLKQLIKSIINCNTTPSMHVNRTIQQGFALRVWNCASTSEYGKVDQQVLDTLKYEELWRSILSQYQATPSSGQRPSHRSTVILKTPNTFNSDYFFHIQKVSTAWATSVCRAMEKSKKKDKIEMDSLVESGENSVKNSPSGDDEKQNLQVPVSGQTYGSTLSIGPEASTANLLKIDLEKKISRHTGKRYFFFATGKWKGCIFLLT